MQDCAILYNIYIYESKVRILISTDDILLLALVSTLKLEAEENTKLSVLKTTAEIGLKNKLFKKDIRKR